VVAGWIKPDSERSIKSKSSWSPPAFWNFGFRKQPRLQTLDDNALTLNANGQTSTSGRINPLSDLDFFSVTTPVFSGQGTLVITMTPTAADRGLDAWIQLQNSGGTLLVERDAGGDNAAEMLTFSQTVGGATYYVVCRSADFFDAGLGDYTLQVSLLLPRPNLVPFQLSGWSDRIVVSTASGSTTDSTLLTATNTLYIDWAILNGGTVGTANRFFGALYVDGGLQASWFSDPPLNPNFYVSVQDYAIGPLTIGTHTIRIVADATGAVFESDESDNEYTKTISVVDDDPNDQISGAGTLGAIGRTITAPGTVDASTDVDLFSFTVVAGQRISFDIDQTSGLDSYLRLFSASGVELAANDNAMGPGEVSSGPDSYVEYTFPNGGTFYVGVSSSGNTAYDPIIGNGDVSGSTGNYTLVLSPGLAGTIRKPGSTMDYLVDLLRFGSNPPVINSPKRTFIVIHGWNSSRNELNIFSVAEALFRTQPADQVLTLDWSEPAGTGVLDPFSAEDAILPVSQWTAAVLNAYGFTGTNLNLAGHSFGSYVAAEIAERIPGGVNSIVTLDPAADVFGGYSPASNDEVNFARDSLFSWSFHSSSAGNEYTPTTADEAFIVESGTTTTEAHRNVVFLFSYLLLNPGDPIGQYFLFNFLLNGMIGPWLPDEFESSFFADDPVRGYEAVIGTTNNGLRPSELTYVPLPRLTIVKTEADFSILWHAYYTNFVLQSSLVTRQTAWTDFSEAPLLIGQSNSITIAPTQTTLIFRLKRR
jgi:pimeloyl-ACP methyl ester carboxylesterase